MDTAKETVLIVKRIKTILEYVNTTTAKLLETYTQKNQDSDVLIFCLCMLNRLNDTVAGMGSLIQLLYNNASGAEYCAGILMRASVLDHIIIISAHSQTEKVQDRDKQIDLLNEFCLPHLSDSLKRTIEYLNSEDTSIDPKDKQKIINRMREENQYLYKVGQNNVRTSSLKYEGSCSNIKTLIKQLKLSPSFKDYHKQIHELYIYYSKYDHFGYMAHTLNRQEIWTRLVTLEGSVFTLPLSIISLGMLLSLLYPADDLSSTLNEAHELQTRLMDERMERIKEMKKFLI
jgi:hypothetical protein